MPLSSPFHEDLGAVNVPSSPVLVTYCPQAVSTQCLPGEWPVPAGMAASPLLGAWSSSCCDRLAPSISLRGR